MSRFTVEDVKKSISFTIQMRTWVPSVYDRVYRKVWGTSLDDFMELEWEETRQMVNLKRHNYFRYSDHWIPATWILMKEAELEAAMRMERERQGLSPY